MTVIVGAKFTEGVVLISDSRATITQGGNTFPSDNLQKIVGIDENIIVAYATNNLLCIENVLGEYQYHLSENPDLTPERKIQKFAEFCAATFSMYAAPFVFLFAIKVDTDWVLYEFDAPTFESKIVSGVSTHGSGSYIRDSLAKYYTDSIPVNNTMRQKADSLVRAMMTALNGPNSATIGGLPQALILTQSGVSTVHTGYVSFSPEGEPDSKQIIYKEGGWVQQDGANGSQIAIIAPNQIANTDLSAKVFYNYEKTSKKEIKWYLNSFELYKDLSIEHSVTTFGFRMGSLLVLEAPQQVEASLYISAFGPSTEHDIEVALEDPSKRKQILFSEHFDNTKFPYELEFIHNCTFTIYRKGKHYLICKINGVEVGRKVLYAYVPRSTKSLSETQLDMTAFLDGYTDTQVAPHLSLFTLSGEEPEITDDRSSVSINDQFSQIYYNNYPVNVDIFLYVTLQANPGEYDLTVDFIDAINKDVLFSGSVNASSTSITNTVPSIFMLNPLIQHKGFYFFRASIDGRIVGAMPFFADGYPPITYELTEQVAKHIQDGGLLKFVKRPVDISSVEE